jgi:hypothetical protein
MELSIKLENETFSRDDCDEFRHSPSKLVVQLALARVRDSSADNEGPLKQLKSPSYRTIVFIDVVTSSSPPSEPSSGVNIRNFGWTISDRVFDGKEDD